MNSLVEFPLLTVFVVAIVIMVLFNVLSPKRPPQIRPPRIAAGAPLEKRTCFFCKVEHPAYAAFCKACGKRL